ncbi:NAD(P)/FAD-dependent oxidoreductase [Parahaliea maris]|uniref:NAD(P)/FAD-dependent oxidoreductase n=1 Tax=Parahaliea maris TaxID=2716870 RepID=A0A5C9A671_9GAMM|nr:NAD(P)/FAD-dependent oxidoreductase [Parahaliea maris]TXS95270.1 NAD(P)/FAD-dependent oxidoreductase [Parahaliea maris]
MTERVDCVVVGAGVVGLAVARAMSGAGLETLVLEREHQVGSGTSSRNSEVIHAGIYYPRGSVKAQLCVEGRQMLYDFCSTHGVAHRRCGKLIVATGQDQVDQLENIRAAATGNGVNDLRFLPGDEAMAMEPGLQCAAALLSPSTGIIDSHALMLALQGELEHCGGMVAFGAHVKAGRLTGTGIRLDVTGDADMSLETRFLVNCAGLYAWGLAGSLDGIERASIPPRFLAKGNYYTLAGRSPFTRLVYPVPEDGGLGIHLTLDLGGRARFGPDVEWTTTIDYEVDPSRSSDFYDAIRQYWPALPDNSLAPGYAGIRPKVSGPGDPAGDFTIQGEAGHGIPGLVNLYGIESPGLTASLAIGARVRQMLLDH